MGICSECKHAVFGLGLGFLGNYCAVDKHSIKAEGACTIGEFVQYEPKDYEPPKSAGCADDDDAYSMPGWWSPSSNLTQLEYISSCVHNADYSRDAADHLILAKFARDLLHLDRVMPARVETAEFSVVDPGGASDTYIRFVSRSLNVAGSSESFSNIKATQDAKNFIDRLIDLYDGQISVSNIKIGPGVSNVKFNGGKHYTAKTPITSSTMMLHINGERVVLDFSSVTSEEEIVRAMNQNLDDRGVSEAQAFTDDEPDMQIISMRRGNWIFYLEAREGATLEEITEAYQKAVMMSNLQEYCETDALCEKELVSCPSGDLEVVKGEIEVTLAKTSYELFQESAFEAVSRSLGVPSDWLNASFELANQPYLPERYKK